MYFDCTQVDFSGVCIWLVIYFSFSCHSLLVTLKEKKTFAHGSSWSGLNWVPVKLDYLSVAVDDIFSGEKNTRVQNHVGCFCLTCRHPIMTHWNTFPRSRCSSRTLIRSRFLIWIWSKVLIYRRTTKKLHKETQQCDLFWHKVKFLVNNEVSVGFQCRHQFALDCLFWIDSNRFSVFTKPARVHWDWKTSGKEAWLQIQTPGDSLYADKTQPTVRLHTLQQVRLHNWPASG